MSDSHEITVRVRYAETDRMGLLHHANYFVYFEMARTEMLRQRGISYREIEDAGHFLVIIDIGCKFKRPAHYDDLLTVRTTVAQGDPRQDRAPIRGLARRLLLAEGHSTLACVDREGKPQALPEILTVSSDRRQGRLVPVRLSVSGVALARCTRRSGRRLRGRSRRTSRLPALSATHRLSSFSQDSTQRATGPAGHSMIPAAVRVSARLPVLNATLVPGGSSRGNLSRSSQARRCVEHLVAGLRADELPCDRRPRRAGPSRAAVVLPRPNCLLRSGKTDVSRRKTFEWILVLG